MLDKLFNSKKRGDDKQGQAEEAKAKRSDRIYEDNNRWFFKTREGMDVGPFLSKGDAQYALLYFTERNEWPSDEQLQNFIEGCELFDNE